MSDSKDKDLPSANSHRRRNALTGEWVLVSPHRLDRPWQGEYSEGNQDAQSTRHYDENCYLCPGNVRTSGASNPDYQGVYVFDNDHAALQSSDSAQPTEAHRLFTSKNEQGICRVVCFSPDHSLTLSDLSASQVTAIVDTWAEQTRVLGQRFPDGSVQIFENKGEMMGCSQPHPHGQIWAQQTVPTSLKLELKASRDYLEDTGSPLLADYAALELLREERVVFSNDHFVVVVPYWATWPFETLICPRRLINRLPQLTEQERNSFADVLRRLSVRYDNLFGVSFPYSAGLHQAPANGEWNDCFSMHMHFFPPLLRSVGVRKFMVGYEMLAEAQRDLTPEAAAAILRELSDERGASQSMRPVS